jgi:class 3 adenylate cyclase
VFVSGINVTVMSRQRWKLLLEQRESKLATLVSTVAVSIPSNLVSQVGERPDDNTPAHRALVAQLRTLRNANRRLSDLNGADLYVNYLYILRPVADSPGLLEFVADAEETRQDMSRVGDIYRFREGGLIDPGSLQVSETIRKDQWGTWFSANAPIRDPKTGRVVGLVLANVSAARIEHNVFSDIMHGLIGIAISLPLILGCALLLSRWIRRPLQAMQTAVAAIGSGDLSARVQWLRRDEFGSLATQVNEMAAGLEERDRIKSAFARYVSQTVMERVMRSGDTSMLRGDRRMITVLFSDIRGFTTLSEERRPEEVVQLLNRYFERMIEIAIRNHGWVDKFLGDGLMITFGAFETDPDHEAHAVQTALEMQAALRVLSREWEAVGLPAFGIGVGINSGYAVVGEIGSSDRV